MKAQRRSRGIAPLIPNFGARWEWSTSRPGRFTLGKETRYPFYRELGGTQSRSERFREEKNLFSLPEFVTRNLLGGGLVNYRRSCSLYVILSWRQDSSVSIVTWLRGRRSRNCGLIPRGVKISLQNIQHGSSAHQPCSTMCTRGWILCRG